MHTQQRTIPRQIKLPRAFSYTTDTDFFRTVAEVDDSVNVFLDL